MSRKEKRRGPASIEVSVDASIQRLEDYIEKHGERLITSTRNNTHSPGTNRTEIIRKQKWQEKQLYGCFKRLTSDISHEKTGKWQRKENLKRKTVFFPIVSQNNAIRTNHIKARIDKTQQDSRCRLCGDRVETSNHIISKCRKFSQKEYKTRHDWVRKGIYWELCK